MKFIAGMWLGAVLGLAPLSAAAADWVQYDAGKYGFSMLVPKGTKLAEQESKDGWGVLAAEYEGVKLAGCAVLGRHYSVEEVEKFGVKLTGIEAEGWKVLEQGKTRGKWSWYKTVLATSGDDACVATYGIGPRGTYLLLLRTTVSDYQANTAAYQKWYRSLTLHGGWKIYSAGSKYQFSMLVPEDTKKVAEAEKGEWGAFHAEHKGVHVWGLAKLGSQHSVEEIEAFGVEQTGVPADHWKIAEKVEKVRGWTWCKTAVATHGDVMVVAIYGVSEKGSYLVFVKTSKSDYQKHQATYDAWHESIFLDR